MKVDDSFDAFYRKYKARIFTYLLRMTGDPGCSNDFTQESFARYYSRYRDTKKSRALLYTIARNTALDAFRKKKEEEMTREKVDPSGQTPEQSLIEKQQIQQIQNAVNRLEPLDRELIGMAAKGCLTYKEIGKRLGLSESNVKVKIHRARMRLRDMYQNGGV